MGGLQGWQTEATRNASKPVRKINFELTEVELEHLSHLLQNDVTEQQRRVDEGEMGFDLIRSKLLLGRCRSALE